MKAIFVIQTSPEENQASILKAVQSQIDQLSQRFNFASQHCFSPDNKQPIQIDSINFHKPIHSNNY